MSALKFKDLFNKKRVNWTSEQEYDLGSGKTDTHPASKIFIFLPLAVILSCAVIVVAVIGAPTAMDLVKSGLDHILPQQTEDLKGAAEVSLFGDVKADSRYFDALAYLKKNGVISGYDDNTFRPYQELSRGELIKTIVAAKREYPLALNYNNCFKDVGTEWYAPAICLAKEKGWVNGYGDKTFHPTETLTKAEALKMIMEAFAIKETPDAVPPLNNFADLDKDAWYYNYIKVALERKLLDENPNIENFGPEAPATRGEAAQIIYRVLLQS